MRARQGNAKRYHQGESPGCGNAVFPKLTGSPDPLLTLAPLPLDALSGETWLRNSSRLMVP